VNANNKSHPVLKHPQFSLLPLPENLVTL